MTYEQIIQKVGKRIIPRVYYYENGNEISIDRDEFQQAKFKYNASLVGTVMCGVELEMKVELPDTEIFIEIEARYGENSQKKVYGGYFRKEDPEYNADAKTYTYEMYDKIIKTMVDYKPISIEYPTTVFDFFKQLIKELELTTNISQLPNGEKVIESDIYDGIEYTYRDVLNDIGQATATLFIVENNEVKKCSFGTSEIVIDDDILKNQNITLGKHFGPINTIVLTRAGESDSIYYPKTLPENPIEFRIAENQLMNENNREEFLEAIYNQLKGIEFDIYDTALVGFGGFDPLAKIKISTGENEYTSYVFNNEITISQGYEETIYTEMPTETSTDYKASDNTDRRINQVYIIARKLEKEILAIIDTTNEIEKSVNPTGTASGTDIYLDDSMAKPLLELEIEGKSVQNGTPTPDTPIEIESVGDYNSETTKYDVKVEVTKETDINSLLIALDKPLRSLPNGVKDIAYIKNNELYVERYVGSIVLNGSENWVLRTDYLFDNYVVFRNGSYNGTNYKLITSGSGLSDYFVVVPSGIEKNNIRFLDTPGYGSQITISKDIASTLEEFKTWLSTHNTQVDYELETPVTENYGEIDMLSALNDYCNITTSNSLKPTLNIKYVRNAEVAKYVENHVTQLKLTEEEIRQSVETVSNSVDGLTTDITRVENVMNDNSQVINIISTNIDRTTGEVREVTTTTGFTFNAVGMEISDETGYKAQHTAKGTFYKDGETITGQYTKDGSKQKDLELFGTYSYGKNSINDTPMFVGQLYTDSNGEEGFGHFYNGGGY